jgi:hypothetical protein
VTTVGERIVALAKTQVGKPYVWGAMGPNGFDCSGLVSWAAKLVGIKGLPRTSQEMRKVGTPVPLSQIAIGDLVTFTYADRRGDNPGPANHVALYAGGGQVVQASGSRVNVAALDTKHIDRVIRLPEMGGAIQAGASDGGAGSGGGAVTQVFTAQQAGYTAATRTDGFGAPVNPFKLPGWIASGSTAAADTSGGITQAGLTDKLTGGVSIPWDGVATVILSSLFVLAGVALVVVGFASAVKPPAPEGGTGA